MRFVLASLPDRLRASFHWLTSEGISDPSAWWKDGDLLREIGSSLAELHTDPKPTVVAGIESRGFMLGALAAVHLGVGFIEVRKNLDAESAGTRLLRCTTPPDYSDRSLVLSVSRHLLSSTDRVLLVDDWIETGGQATAVRDIVVARQATWIGVSVIVDALPAERRRALNVRALLRESSLPWYRRPRQDRSGS